MEQNQKNSFWFGVVTKAWYQEFVCRKVLRISKETEIKNNTQGEKQHNQKQNQRDLFRCNRNKNKGLVCFSVGYRIWYRVCAKGRLDFGVQGEEKQSRIVL